MSSHVGFLGNLIATMPEGASCELHSLSRKIPELLANSVAGSTGDKYMSTFKRFEKFCNENFVPSLPSDPVVIMSYFVKISDETNSASSVLLARSAIRHFNLVHSPNVPSPTDNMNVAMLVKGIERKFSAECKKRKPTTPQIVRSFIDLLNGDQCKWFGFSKSLEDWQVVAKTVVKFHCFARFEEVIELKRSSFRFLSNGDVEVKFCKGKNNQFHDAKVSVIAKYSDEGGVYCPVNIVRKYFLVLGRPHQEAFFLPKICKNLPLFDVKASYSSCIKRFKLFLMMIGENPEGYGEHSDRTGGLSSAAASGCSVSDLQTQGRWKSDYAPKLYLKKSKEKRSKVSKALNELVSIDLS